MKFVWILLLAGAAKAAAGEGFTPASVDTLIATWSPTPRAAAAALDSSTAARLANAYLVEAALPGRGHLYGQAEAILGPALELDANDAELWFALARVQQHRHDFTAALRTLDRVTQLQPRHPAAQLLRARIYLVQDQPAQARRACFALLGQADLLTVSACALESESEPERLKGTYDQLVQLVERTGLPSDARRPWLLQLLADMAQRLGDLSAADHWVGEGRTGASVSFLAQWADVQLALGRPQLVLQEVGPLVSMSGDDDALLLRLAHAELLAGGTGWQQRLRARVTLRGGGADTEHAGELARYYLDLKPDPVLALHWAEVNWQRSREWRDRELLERARQLAKQGSL